MTPTLSHEQFLAKLSVKNPCVSPITQYIGANKPMTYICTKCGTQHSIQRAGRLLEGRKCTQCAANDRADRTRCDHNDVVKQIASVNQDIAVLSQYTNNATPLRCQCRICGHIWYAMKSSLLAGHGCPECAHTKQGWLTTETYIQRVKERFPMIDILSEYNGSTKTIVCHCNDCNTSWKTTASVLLRKGSLGCPYCSMRTTPTERQLVERLQSANPSVLLLDGFTAMSSNAHFSCVKCGYDWYATPSNVLRGTACPRCSASRGERRIQQYLDDHRVCYMHPYAFDDCVDVRPLPFDFYIPDLHMCIEYDGEQHFKPVAFGGDQAIAQDKFMRGQRHDKIKNEYCEANGLTLLRIPYTDYEEIFDILRKHLP